MVGSSQQFCCSCGQPITDNYPAVDLLQTSTPPFLAETCYNFHGSSHLPMRMSNGDSHQQPAISNNGLPGDMRKHILAGLAIARRSLANARDDAAMGVNIDPSTIAELERTVHAYVQMLDNG
jgi:hypothetical protein